MTLPKFKRRINWRKVRLIAAFHLFLTFCGYGIGAWFIFAENHPGEYVAYAIAVLSSAAMAASISRTAWDLEPYIKEEVNGSD